MMYYAVEEKGKELWLVQEQYDPRYERKTESVFAQCNGYFGVRASGGLPALGEQRGMFVAGLFNRAYEEEVTELVNCPDVTGYHLIFREQEITPDRTEMSFYRRAFCLATGELEIIQRFVIDEEHVLEVREQRFASMDNPHILAQKVCLRAVKGEFPELDFVTEMNGQQTNSGVSHFHKVECRVYDKRLMHLQGYLKEDILSVISDCVCSQKSRKEPLFTLKRRGISARYKAELAWGAHWNFEKYTYIDHGSSTAQVGIQRRRLEEASKDGYEKNRAKHQSIMDRLWDRAAVHIEGASPKERASIAFAQYHIMGMMPWNRKDSSIAAKGLTGEGYKGHVFWDTEIFLLPFFTYLFPEQSRNLLEFRYDGLAGARKKAEDFGYEGAMYPWEVAVDGTEETPLYAALNIHTGKANKVWSGLKEHHVTADIGYALEQYLDMTGDREFLCRCGYEMLFEIAAFWVSRAEWSEEKQALVILDIIGPDEYTEHIDNNAYTNYMAGYCVKLALSMTEQAQKDVPELCRRLRIRKRQAQWEEFLEKLYLPRPNKDQILPQDDTFLSKKCVPDIERYKTSRIKQKILQDYSRDEIVDMQVLKQADVVMLLNLFPRMFAPDIVKKNVLFYEARTIHDSSLSLCAHAQACAVIREKELAWKFFEACTETDLDDNPYDSTDGIHAASMGGIWSCLIFGFAGVSFQDGTLYLDPQLPKHWKSMRFKLCVHGKVIDVEIGEESVCLRTENQESADLLVQVNGKRAHLRERCVFSLASADEGSSDERAWYQERRRILADAGAKKASAQKREEQGFEYGRKERNKIIS